MPYDPAPRLHLRKGDRERLEALARKRTAAQRDVLRARIILLCADGVPHRQIKRQLHTSVDTIVRWRQQADLSSVAGKPVRLRFAMKDADLYAFRFADR